MSESFEQAQELSFWDKHRFLLMILLAITVASGLVGISMALYVSSGAAQLDLSRPGYQGVQNQVDRANDVQNYPISGPINQESVDEFQALFETQASRVKAINAFSGDPLNPSALGINDPKN